MARNTDALSQVYARSLYELAEKAGGQEKLAEVANELEQICELARGDRGFREFLASPLIEKSSRSASIARIFRDRITDLTLRFLLVVNDKNRLTHLESINSAYDLLVQESFGAIEVDVFTPMPLDDNDERTLSDRIRAALGKVPVLHMYTDESMLGGIRLRIGDQLIDGSVATRLRRMRESLLASGSTAIRERFSKFINEEDTP